MTWSELSAAAAGAVPGTRSVSILEGNNCLDLVVQFAAAVAGDRQCVVLDPAWPSQIRAEIIDRLPLSEAADGVDLIDGDPTSPFLISLTSATTTSFPKAVSRTRMSWQMSFEASGRFFGLRPDDRTLAPGSLAAGLNLFALAECLYNGSPFHALESFDVADAHEAIAHDGVSRLILVPSALRLLSERGLLGGIDASGIRTIICAGSKLDVRTLQAARRWAPHANIFEYYGAAELSFVSAKLRVSGESAECDTTLGRPWAGVAVQVCGNDGSPLPDGQVGSIHVRSDLASEGYLWDGTGTARKPADGWWTVGDDGFLRDGELHLLGRRSDVINSAGNMVYPHEVELALTSVPGVAAAVVAGTPAPQHDQHIVAGVITSVGGITATFLESAMERLLDSAKLPSQYFLLTELPLTDRGKVSRRVLIDWVRAQDTRAFPLGRDSSRGVLG